MSSPLPLALVSFSWTCCWGAWSSVVTGPVIPSATFCCQLSLPLPWIAEPQKCLFPEILGLLWHQSSCLGRSIRKYLKKKKKENIWVSFMAHTTWEKFFSMRLPLIVQSHGGTSRHIQRGKNLFYTLPLDSAGLQLLHHVELVPRLKARFLREFAATPDNTWESGALALMFCYSLVFILVSLKFNPLIPWRFGIWPPFHNFLFLSDMEVFSSSFISFLVWLGVCLYNVIFQDVMMEIMQRIMIIYFTSLTSNFIALIMCKALF